MGILILRAIHDSSCIVSIFLNVSLITLILTKTPTQLRNYSFVLWKFTIIELISAVACLFIFNRIMSTDAYDINAITGPCHLTGSSTLCFLSYAIMMHGHSHYCIMLAFGFCYRYYVTRYSTPSTSSLIVALTLVYVPTAVIYLFFALTPLLDEVTLKEVVSDAYPAYDFNTTTRSELMIGTHMSHATILGMLWTQAMIVPVYIVIIAVSIRVHRFLSSTLNMNESSKKMHKQAMKALAIQSLLPTLYFVAAALHAAHDRGLVPEWGEAGHLPPTIGSVTLVASNICTFAFIKPYQAAIRSLFCRVTDSRNSSIALKKSSEIRKYSSNR